MSKSQTKVKSLSISGKTCLTHKGCAVGGGVDVSTTVCDDPVYSTLSENTSGNVPQSLVWKLWPENETEPCDWINTRRRGLLVQMCSVTTSKVNTEDSRVNLADRCGTLAVGHRGLRWRHCYRDRSTRNRLSNPWEAAVQSSRCSLPPTSGVKPRQSQDNKTIRQ